MSNQLIFETLQAKEDKLQAKLDKLNENSIISSIKKLEKIFTIKLYTKVIMIDYQVLTLLDSS